MPLCVFCWLILTDLVVCKLSKARCKSIGPSREVTNTKLAWPGLSGAAGLEPGCPVGWGLAGCEDMEELHWTQLNLLLLSNLYKQISAGGGEPSLDQLNCGGCSQVFPVSALAQYIQHKAGGQCSQSSSVKPLGSPTISGSDQVDWRDTDAGPGPGMMSYDKFCFT